MNLFDFANPIGWWAALLAAPVVLLYILKTRMRRQEVSTLLFWDQIFEETRPRAWWRQLRRLLSLLLQLAFLALLVGALVDPLWSWQRRLQRRVVLVLDNSASMQAVEADGTTRLDLAKDAGRAMVRSLRGADQMAILAAGGAPRVVIGMTDHQNSLLEAIDGLPATDGPTAVAPAIDLAERLLTDFEGQSEVAVLTDGCFTPRDDLKDDKRVTLYGVGNELDNVAITRYQVRRSLLDAIGYQVLIEVTNFSAKEKSCRLELDLEKELVDVVPLKLAPGETAIRVLDHTSAEGGRLVAKLDSNDALPIDNTALALLPRRDPIPVVLVTEGNLFLQSVLQSIPLVDLKTVAESPKAAPIGGVLVLDGATPQQLPAGRVMVIDPQNGCDLWTLGDPIADPIVTEVDDASPLTRHVRLTNVAFPGARALTLKEGASTLIKAPNDQPLFAQLPRSGGDVLVLSSNLEKGDLPLRIAFPVLMKNAIEWFQGVEGELRPTTPSGSMVSVSLKPLLDKEPTRSEASAAETKVEGTVVVENAQEKVAKDYTLTSPSGEITPIVTPDEQAMIGPLMATGLWSVTAAKTESVGNAENATEAPAVDIACNLASPVESDLRPRAGVVGIDELQLSSLGGHPPWFYLTLLATGLIVAEWWLYQRRIVE